MFGWLLQRARFTRFYFAEEGGEEGAGGGGAGGGGEGGKSEEGGKKAGEETLYDIKVDGQERKVTLDELRLLAEKAGGAEARFEAASTMRKEAERGLRIARALEKVKAENPKDEDVKEFYDAIGTPEQYQAYLKAKEDAGGGNRGGNRGGNGDEEDKLRRKLGLDDFDDQTKELLRTAQEGNREKTREKVEAMIKSKVSEDPVLKKLLDSVQDEATRKDASNEIIAMANEMVKERVLTGAPFGPELLDSVAQRLRHRVQKLGIPTSKMAGKSSTLGLGLLGADAMVGTNLLSDEPVKRVPITDSNWINNVVERTQKKALELLRKAGSG